MNNIDGALDSAGTYGLDDEPFVMVCQGCNGMGEAYMGRFSPRQTTCRECTGTGVVEVDDTW